MSEEPYVWKYHEFREEPGADGEEWELGFLKDGGYVCRIRQLPYPGRGFKESTLYDATLAAKFFASGRAAAEAEAIGFVARASIGEYPRR